MSDEERTNLQMRQSLIDLNNSLFMSEALENVDMLVPFDKIKIGSEMK